jgi:hypothetical protein
MTVIDYTTKRVRFIPTFDDATAYQTAVLFFDYIVSQFGLPKSIVSDRDSKFTSEFWINLMTLLGTKMKMSAVDHPQTDGLAERAHRTLNSRLRTLINHEQNDWNEHLSAIEFQMNSSINVSTGFAPFDLDIGRIPRSPLDFIIEPIQKIDNITAQENSSTDIASTLLVQKLRNNLAAARDNIKIANDHQEMQANKTRRQQTFEVGDQVLVESQALRTHSAQALRPETKLSLITDGPYKILKVVNDNAYKLDIPSSFAVHPVVNVSKLRAYIPNKFSGRTTDPPPPVMGTIGEERYVHAILGHKKSRGRRPKNKPQQYM